jgi:hypothetical protein
MMLVCHTIEVLLQGSCYPTNLFFLFSFSWLKSLCWELVLFEAAIITTTTTTTPTYTSKLQNTKMGLLPCHVPQHGSWAVFWLGLKRVKCTLIVLVPPPLPSPPPNFIDLSLII